MPTIMTHAVVGIAVASIVPPRRRPRLLGTVSAGLAMLPDVDVLAFPLGVPHGSMWSHRGVTHSLAAAILTAVAVATVGYRRSSPSVLVPWLFAAMASHGILDSFTNGGSGIAFFAPFDRDRYFFPWRPVEVSPLGLNFFSTRGLTVLQSEFRWIWLPATVLAGSAALFRFVRRIARRRR
jgi:inner membrane protein